MMEAMPEQRQAPLMPTEPGSTSKIESTASIKRRKAGLQLGQRIDDFELQGFLGRGSYASVYKACSRQSNRQVAIKVIDKQLIAACPGMADRVRYEAETHIALDHPSIVRLHTFFEDRSRVYFVMDLCEGGELYQYLRKRGKGLPIAEGRRIFEQVVRGVQHLHSQNIAHRDLKLSNLLLTADLQVKISDFGLSVTLAGEGGESGTVCGTPNYMAPEVICRAPHGLSSDVWALGCLLYTVLVGKPPFESSTVEATLQRINNVQFEIPAYVPRAASDLIRRLLVKDPASRMSLESILSHEFVRGDIPEASSPVKEKSDDSTHFLAHKPSQDASLSESRSRPVVTAHSSSEESLRRTTWVGKYSGSSSLSIHLNSRTSDILKARSVQGMEPSVQKPKDVPAPASSLSPHLSSGKALRDRRALVSRSWDPHGEKMSHNEEGDKYGSADGLRMTRPVLANGHGLHGLEGSDGGLRQNGQAMAHQRGSGAKTGLGLSAFRTETADAPSCMHLPLSQVRNSLEEFLPHRPVHNESSFASTMMSARSHKVATPVQSCRTVPDQQANAPEAHGFNDVGMIGREGSPRIDTRGMKAHRYDTRFAEVVIDRQGTVFLNAKGTDTVLRVETGGEIIRVLSRRFPPSLAPDDAKSVEGASAIDEERFTLDGLPGKWRRLYAYAAKVLTLIQSKTPKVIYYSPHAKAQLMDDGRGGLPATFLCNFYDGCRVQSTPCNGVELGVSMELYVPAGRKPSIADGTGDRYSGEPAEARLRAHAAECLQICRNAEAQCLRAGAERSNGAEDAKTAEKAPFPAVFAHKLAMHRLQADHAAARAPAPRPQPPLKPSPSAPKPKGGPGALLEAALGMSTTQLSVSEASQRSGAPSSSGKQSRASTAASTAQPSPAHSHLAPALAGAPHGASGPRCDAVAQRQAKGDEQRRRGLGQDCGRGAAEDVPRVEQEGRVFEFEEAESRPVVSKAAFFEGLGWVMRLEDGAVWAQLPDGCQIVATNSQVVAVTTSGERVAVFVERGQLQGGHATLPRRLLLSAQQVLSLRDIL